MYLMSPALLRALVLVTVISASGRELAVDSVTHHADSLDEELYVAEPEQNHFNAIGSGTESKKPL